MGWLFCVFRESQAAKKRVAYSAAVCTHSGKVTAYQKISSYSTMHEEDNPKLKKHRSVFLFFVRIRGPPSSA